MKYIIILLLVWHSNQAGRDLYACKNARISLYSKAPIEDIEAVSGSGTSVYNVKSGDINFSVPISSFKFPKALMQEHFNSDYMESDKYPKASFKGKINEKVDVSKDGSYPITATGALTVHNVTQNRTIPGTITIKNGTINIAAEFMVNCADHHIKIPQLVFHNIAETIKLNIQASYLPYPLK